LRRTRVIPVLLLKGQGFYKTKKFDGGVYLGDPINILKIFNDKEVDEICVLDIGATPAEEGPRVDYLGEFASECFMPLTYGGGISTLDQVRRLFKTGVEKCVFNTAAHEDPGLVEKAAREFGSQSIVVSMDVRNKFLGGRDVCIRGGRVSTGMGPAEYARRAEDLGAGEILLNSIERDGSMGGYDLELARSVADSVSVPVILCGGAGSVEDFRKAVEVGIPAVAAGAMFVFQGPHRAVLINVPPPEVLDKELP
tara:strand:+ start:5121 stop:5879 length:759 start_codon:yes stop_codon:yes gene_type:complete